MLDLRCVLCFIHADIWIQILKMFQKSAVHTQHFICIQHLVIVIHPFLFPHLAAICLVYASDTDIRFFFQFLNFFIIQQHILDVSDHRPHIFQITFRRVSHAMFLADLNQHPGRILFLLHQFKWCLPDFPSVILNDLCTDSVDRPELQLFCHLFSKTIRKSF